MTRTLIILTSNQLKRSPGVAVFAMPRRSHFKRAPSLIPSSPPLQTNEAANNRELAKPVLTEGSEADVQWWITLGLTIINAIELLFILLAFYAIIAVAPAALVSC